MPANDTINYTLNKKTTNANALDGFTAWLLFTQENNLLYYSEIFKSFIAQLSALYITGCRTGAVYAAPNQWNPILCDSNLFINTSSIHLGALINVISKVNNVRNSFVPITPGTKSPCFYKVGWGNNYADITQITGIFGSWIYTIYKQGNAVSLLSSREITMDMIHRQYGRCQHCGGMFKGLINPVCKQCGKLKDY